MNHKEALENLRNQLMDVLVAKMSKAPLGKQIDVLRDFVYEVLEYLDEEALVALIEQFSK